MVKSARYSVYTSVPHTKTRLPKVLIQAKPRKQQACLVMMQRLLSMLVEELYVLPLCIQQPLGPWVHQQVQAAKLCNQLQRV